MKRFIAILLLILLVFGACDSAPEVSEDSSVAAESSSQAVTEESSEVSEEESEESTYSQEPSSEEPSSEEPSSEEPSSEEPSSEEPSSEEPSSEEPSSEEPSSEEPSSEEPSSEEPSSEESSEEPYVEAKLNSLKLSQSNNIFVGGDITFTINHNTKTATANKGVPHPQTTPLVFSFDVGSNKLYFAGTALKSGSSTVTLGSSPKLIIVDNKGRTVEYKVVIPDTSRGVAVVYLNTNTSGLKVGNVNNISYTMGTFTVLSPDGNTIAEPAGFRLRGNSTLGLDKKSFRVKCNEKAAVMNFGDGKNWVLLANHADKSLLRNMSAFYMSSILDGIEYTPAITPAEVYFNGEYIGLYTLGHHLQVKGDRVDIEEGSDKADTGYFIECDVRAAEEDRPYFNIDGMLFSILSPDEPNAAQIQFITDLIDNINTLTKSKSAELWNYLDMDSGIDWLITKELCGATSMGYDAYLYRDKGGKVFFGPVWDFDLAFGNADFGDAHRSDRLYVMHGSWFAYWFQCGDFAERFLERWDEVKKTYIPQLKTQIMKYYEDIKDAAEHNFQRWDILYKYVWPNPPLVMQTNTHKGQVELLIKYINEHIICMDEYLAKYR